MSSQYARAKYEVVLRRLSTVDAHRSLRGLGVTLLLLRGLMDLMLLAAERDASRRRRRLLLDDELTFLVAAMRSKNELAIRNRLLEALKSFTTTISALDALLRTIIESALDLVKERATRSCSPASGTNSFAPVSRRITTAWLLRDVLGADLNP